MPEQEAVFEGVSVNHLVLAAAGEELGTVRGKAQAVPRLVERDPAEDFWLSQVKDHYLVPPVAGVERGEPMAAGVQGQVDREVAQLDLPAGGPQRPLVGQPDGTVSLQ